MKVIETTTKEKPSHIVVNTKKSCYNYAYTTKEEAQEEAVIDAVINGKEFISVIKYTNQTLVNELDIVKSGKCRANNKAKIL